MAESVAHDRWANLLPELLDTVVKYVDSYRDYVRLRTVCKTWNFELPKSPEHIKNPWLVLPFDENEILRPCYNFWEKKVYHFELPETQKTMFRGSCYGWLITIGIDGAVRLLNPFTRCQFDLPPMSTFPNVIAFQPDHVDEEYTIEDPSWQNYTLDSLHMQKAFIVKVILSSPPDHDHDVMALAIFGEFTRLAYCRLGDSNWKELAPQASIEDATFHEGKIYAIDIATRLFEFDMKTRSPSPVGGMIAKAPPDVLHGCRANRSVHRYLVGTPIGFLLVIRFYYRYDKHIAGNGFEIESCYRTSAFEIYKLNREHGKEPFWSQVNSLGEYVLLLGFNSSMCVLPHTFPDGKGNRIYYTDDNIERHYEQVIGGHDIGMVDLEDGSVNQLFPNIEFLYPSPVWLLHKIP